MTSANSNRCLTIFKQRAFYHVVNNDALILNKYFGYKTFKSKESIRAGFPVASLNKVMHRLDELSINYKVLHGLDVIVEKNFENNLYEIIDETLFLTMTNTSQKKERVPFNYERPDYVSFVNALQGICNNTDFYTGEVIDGISQDTKNQIETILAIFEKRVKKYEEKYGSASNKGNQNRSENVPNKNNETNAIDYLEVKTPVIENIENYCTSENQVETDISKDFQPMCKNCMLLKKGDCFGKDNICEDYRYAPDMDDEKRKNWPKYGDATFFRMHGYKK